MMGLLRGLACRAYSEFPPRQYQWEQCENFGLIPSRSLVSKSVVNPEQSFQISFRYFALLDACPLRMSSVPRASAETNEAP